MFNNIDLSNSILWASNMKLEFKIILFLESKIKFYIKHDFLSIKRSNDTFLLNFLKLLFKLIADWLGNKAFYKSSSTDELWSYIINSILLFSKSKKLISSIKIDAISYLSINVAVLSYYLFFRAVFLVLILCLLKISLNLFIEVNLGISECFSNPNLELKSFV